MADAHLMLRDKRTTRGLRMAGLIGEAADQDEQFWNNGVWGEEDSGNESFSEEEIRPDEFDSDFNDTEDENDEEEDSEPEKEATRADSSKPTNRYKDPSSGRRSIKPVAVAKRKRSEDDMAADGDNEDDDDDDDEDDEDEDDDGDDDDGDGSKRHRKKKIRKGKSGTNAGGGAAAPATAVGAKLKSAAPRLPRSSSQGSDLSTDRTVRQSTKSKTIGAAEAREQADAAAKGKPRVHVQQVRHQFTQRELLEDALQTESDNIKWLENQKLVDDQRAAGEKPVKAKRTEGCIRHLSRRGTYGTITFSDTDSMPAIFSLPAPKPIVKRPCVITGLPAKYLDPQSGQPYATIAAFKEIRRRAAISAPSSRR